MLLPSLPHVEQARGNALSLDCNELWRADILPSGLQGCKIVEQLADAVRKHPSCSCQQWVAEEPMVAPDETRRLL